MQHERSKKHDAPFPDFNAFHKLDLLALAWRIIVGAVQVSTRATPTQFQPLEGSCWMDCAKRILSKYMR